MLPDLCERAVSMQYCLGSVPDLQLTTVTCRFRRDFGADSCFPHSRDLLTRNDMIAAFLRMETKRLAF